MRETRTAGMNVDEREENREGKGRCVGGGKLMDWID